MGAKNKNQKFYEMAWNAYAKDLIAEIKSEKTCRISIGRISKNVLRNTLECDICARAYFQGTNQEYWKKKISRLIDQAKKDGYSAELFECWLNNRDSSPHDSHLLTQQEAHEVLGAAFLKG